MGYKLVLSCSSVPSSTHADYIRYLISVVAALLRPLLAGISYPPTNKHGRRHGPLPTAVVFAGLPC